MDRDEALRELNAMLEEATKDGVKGYTIEEVHAYLDELWAPKNTIYLTGDTHGQFNRIKAFCIEREVEPENTFIILGDVGLNYFGDMRDRYGKLKLSQIPITFFCLHGNHEMRPSAELGYIESEYHGGKVMLQPRRLPKPREVRATLLPEPRKHIYMNSSVPLTYWDTFRTIK